VLQRHYGWKVGVPAYAIASYIAASRLSNARHYLSDVLVGAAVGIIVGRTVTIGVGAERFAVSPMIVPGGGGVQFTWLGSDQLSLSVRDSQFQRR
jgi:membrane-associated phospholipid phosphatase